MVAVSTRVPAMKATPMSTAMARPSPYLISTKMPVRLWRRTTRRAAPQLNSFTSMCPMPARAATPFMLLRTMLGVEPHPLEGLSVDPIEGAVEDDAGGDP